MNPKHAASQAANALGALQDIMATVAAGHPADSRLAELFRQQRAWGSRDRRFIGALVFSYFRWRGWLDGFEPARAAALAYALDAAEAHPAQTVLAGEELPAWGLLPLEQKRIAFAAHTGRAIETSMLVPPWFAACVDPAQAAALIASFQVRPPTWLRARAGQVEAVAEALRRHGASPSVHPGLATALRCGTNIHLDPIHRETGGGFEVQDLASQCVGAVCAPLAGESWWDVCAGSGGKSLHLADLMQDRGRIVATDVRGTALAQLERRTREAGFRCIRVLPAGTQPTRLFDGVLVDAPCSGIGTWSRNPDMRWRTTADTVAGKAGEQRDILARAADSVRPGGVLVYAVCTVTNVETAGVVEGFLAGRADFTAEAFADPRTGAPCPTGVLAIQPEEGPCDGMFMARLRRAP